MTIRSINIRPWQSCFRNPASTTQYVMPVTTISAQPAPSTVHPKQFSTTSADEASQYQRAKTHGDGEDEQLYILTLLTDSEHHKSMTLLRDKYFPRKLNKLEAHLTLFHALPDSKLESDVLPGIEETVRRTAPYHIRSTEPYRLSKGIGIRVADDVDHANSGKNRRNMTRIIHAELRKKWSEWLSEQDSAPPKLHYTVMNKVNDEQAIEKAMEELKETFQQHESQGAEAKDSSMQEAIKQDGDVQGLTLWKYQKSGHWTDPRHFNFTERPQ